MRKLLVTAATALVGLAATPALATPAALDYSAMTGAIDLGTTTAAIMTVGGIVILVSVAIMGVRKVKSMVR